MLEILQERIEQGSYPVGRRLPSERKLAAEFQVPQSQIHKKLQQLVESGLLECFRGIFRSRVLARLRLLRLELLDFIF